jgi:hypothetical protein
MTFDLTPEAVRVVADGLLRAVTTMTNDDKTEVNSEDRMRFIERFHKIKAGEETLRALSARLAEVEAENARQRYALSVIAQFKASTSGAQNVHSIWKMAERASAILALIPQEKPHE